MDKTLSEQDIMTDVLASEKHLINMYAVNIIESNCQNLRNILNNALTEEYQLQFEIFNAMKARNWYPVKNATMQEVRQFLDKFTQMRSSV